LLKTNQATSFGIGDLGPPEEDTSRTKEKFVLLGRLFLSVFVPVGFGSSGFPLYSVTVTEFHSSTILRGIMLVGKGEFSASIGTAGD